VLYFSIFDMYNKDNKKIYLNDAVSKEGDYALIFDKEGELVSLFIAEEFSDMPVPQQIKDICKHIFNIDVEKHQERRLH
jgi:hypothetical protein